MSITRFLLALMLCVAASTLTAAEGATPPRTPELIQAVRSGDVERLRHLVRVEGVSLAMALNAEGDSLLHRVALLVPPERQADWIIEIIALGADANARNGRQRTPLHLAARAGQTAAVVALIERGAQVNAADADAMTPLTDAAEAGRLEALKALLAAGANPNLKPDPRDRTHTPLTIASYQGRVDIVQALISAGADVNLPAARRTALDWARRAKREGVVRLLTSVNAVD